MPKQNGDLGEAEIEAMVNLVSAKRLWFARSGSPEERLAARDTVLSIGACRKAFAD